MAQNSVLARPEVEAEWLIAAAQKVDEAMCSIRDAGKIKARDRIAVLAGLNMAFDMLKQPAASPAASSSPTNASDPAPNDLESGTSAQLRAILDKLDRALHSDGQLL